MIEFVRFYSIDIDPVKLYHEAFKEQDSLTFIFEHMEFPSEEPIAKRPRRRSNKNNPEEA